MKKRPGRSITLAIILILFALLGFACVSGSSGPWPVHAFPQPIPKAVLEPQDVWLKCGGHPNSVEVEMYCVDPVHVEELRVYLIKLHDLATKLNHTIEAINEME